MERLHRSGMFFSEQDIIDLHALFLTAGIHRIKVDSVDQGRSLIDLLLTSLNCYVDVACITTNKAALKTTIYNCVPDLDSQPCAETFLAEQFLADFMWVELTRPLMNKIWYRQVEQYLCSSAKRHHVPVIFVSYEGTIL